MRIVQQHSAGLVFSPQDRLLIFNSCAVKFVWGDSITRFPPLPCVCQSNLGLEPNVPSILSVVHILYIHFSRWLFPPAETGTRQFVCEALAV